MKSTKKKKKRRVRHEIPEKKSAKKKKLRRKKKRRKSTSKKSSNLRLKHLFLALGVTTFVYMLIFFAIFSIGRVDGYSMMPTMHKGELFLVKKRAEIKRFDLVYVRNPLKKEVIQVRRVIGVPGDNVQYKEDELYINQQGKVEPYLNETKEKIKPMILTEDFDLYSVTKQRKVPKNHYFLMGDNRKSSSDSRSYGFVSEEFIIGKIVYPLP